MTKNIFHRSAVGLLTVCLLGLPATLSAQEKKPDASAEKKAPAEKKKASPGPFHGNLAAVDNNAKTITVGKRTFRITSETKISKAGKPAMLSEGVVGEPVSGYIKPSEDGSLVATRVNFGPKAGASNTSANEKPAKPADKQKPKKSESGTAE